MRRILHVDMDAFFAAIEQQRRPELRGKPVIIGGHGDPTERGVVSTASYEARRFGIHSAMPLRTAYRQCPDAIYLPVDFDSYSAVSERIKAILHEFSPACEDSGLDEAYLDISHRNEPPEQIAAAIKKHIRNETGLDAINPCFFREVTNSPASAHFQMDRKHIGITRTSIKPMYEMHRQVDDLVINIERLARYDLSASQTRIRAGSSSRLACVTSHSSHSGRHLTSAIKPPPRTPTVAIMGVCPDIRPRMAAMKRSEKHSILPISSTR